MVIDCVGNLNPKDLSESAVKVKVFILKAA